MDQFKETLYDVMGLQRDAGPHDINRAWNRYRAQMRNESTPPDPRRDALMRHAYETLSDPYKREAYDAALRRESPVLRATKRSPRAVATAGVLVAAALGAAAYALHFSHQPPAKAALPVKPIEEIRDMATRAVGRVQAVDLGGKEATLGVAFAIEPGVMAAACTGLSPDHEALVLSPPRRWPARVTQFDPRGLCRLEVHGGAAFPLVLTGVVPPQKADVYMVDVGPQGTASVRAATVTRVDGGAGGTIVTSLPLTEASLGSPLLDADGRVVAVAVPHPTAGAAYLLTPRKWLPFEEAPQVSPPRVREGDAPVNPDAAPHGARAPVPISPERQQKLNDTFRPPSKVPDEL
ncbi:MAG TPA: trypsin-like peptidase domain-containing protein [Polyangiaceae bacterium]|nr:trypsin-like peptidase domain-containing protein [Polyangiaceae bacterium]